MSKLSSKWYFALVLIPLLINLITNSIGLPDLFKDWTLTLITTLSFLVIVLTYELLLLYRKVKELDFKPKESDKKIIKYLLNTLDVNMFHQDIKNQNSWYGYKQKAISKTLKFKEKAELISNLTSDKRINLLIKDLKEALDDFNLFSSNHLFGKGDLWFAPAKDNDYQYEKAKEACPIMNAKADFAFEKLTVLLEYLKQRNYLE